MAEGGEDIEMQKMDDDNDYDDSEEKNMLFRSEKYNDLSIPDDMNNMRKEDELAAYNEKKDREKKEGDRMRKRREKEEEEYNKKKKALEDVEKHASAEDVPPLEKELLESAINAFYERNGERLPENLFMTNFYRERDAKGRRILMVEGPNGEGYRLSFYKGTGDEQFYALNSLKNDYLVKKYLYIDKNAVGDNEETSVKEMGGNIGEAIQDFQKILGQIPTGDINSEQEGQELLETARNVETTFNEIETSFIENVNDETSVKEIDDLPQRDKRGLAHAFTTIRENLDLNLAKLTKTNKELAKQRGKLEQAESTEDKKRINDEIRKLEEERSARLDALSIDQDRLRRQVNRMKETIHKVLNIDKTLRDKIKTLFREQGVTIVSILTAFGMIIGVIVEALTGGVTTLIPKAIQGGIKEWIKKLGKLLASLAKKAVAALPAIIGSIVSWLLTATKDVVNWFANNLWMLLVLVVGLLYAAAREYINK